MKINEKLKEDIKRKDDLLRDALEWLIACEWEIPLNIIVNIQKELGIDDPVHEGRG